MQVFSACHSYVYYDSSPTPTLTHDESKPVIFSFCLLVCQGRGTTTLWNPVCETGDNLEKRIKQRGFLASEQAGWEGRTDLLL